MPLYRLAYHSLAKLEGDPDEVCRRIVEGARSRNAHYGITGALMLAGDRFIQMLEGRRPHLELLFEYIVQDSRHADIRVVAFQPLARRSFAQWGMTSIEADSELNDAHCRLLAETGDVGRIEMLAETLAAAARRQDGDACCATT